MIINIQLQFLQDNSLVHNNTKIEETYSQINRTRLHAGI